MLVFILAADISFPDAHRTKTRRQRSGPIAGPCVMGLMFTASGYSNYCVLVLRSYAVSYSINIRLVVNFARRSIFQRHLDKYHLTSIMTGVGRCGARCRLGRGREGVGLGYVVILLPKNRVPGYPFKYPTGTRVQKISESPSTSCKHDVQVERIPRQSLTTNRLLESHFLSQFTFKT